MLIKCSIPYQSFLGPGLCRVFQIAHLHLLGTVLKAPHMPAQLVSRSALPLPRSPEPQLYSPCPKGGRPIHTPALPSLNLLPGILVPFSTW